MIRKILVTVIILLLASGSLACPQGDNNKPANNAGDISIPNVNIGDINTLEISSNEEITGTWVCTMSGHSFGSGGHIEFKTNGTFSINAPNEYSVEPFSGEWVESGGMILLTSEKFYDIHTQICDIIGGKLVLQDSSMWEKEAGLEIAWGKKVSPEFKNKVIKIAQRLQIDVNYLMASMAFETGGSFDPAETNDIGATGLIQFLPSTAKELGTTTDALRKMSAVDQLDYVEKYFINIMEQYATNIPAIMTLEDVYMAILWPKAIGQPVETVIFSEGSSAYKNNLPLDSNNDKKVTIQEACTIVRNYLNRGLEAQNKG